MQIHTLSIAQNSVSYKVLAWHELLALAAIPTLLNFIACSVAIPFLENQGLPIAIAYFLSVGLIVLVPMFFAAIFLSAKGIGSFQRSDIFASMRLKKLSRTDWAWVIGGFIGFQRFHLLLPKL